MGESVCLMCGWFMMYRVIHFIMIKKRLSCVFLICNAPYCEHVEIIQSS